MGVQRAAKPMKLDLGTRLGERDSSCFVAKPAPLPWHGFSEQAAHDAGPDVGS
jgi:hypothetical protein